MSALRFNKIALYILSLGLLGLMACGGGNSSSSVPAAAVTPPPPSTPASPPPSSPPQPPPPISTSPRTNLSGLDITLTINAASSFTLTDGNFATEGTITRSFLDDDDMFARTIAPNANEYIGTYDYVAMDETTSRETTTLADGRTYETTYRFTDDMSGTWEENFDLGELMSEGTFTLRPTPIVTDASGNVSLSQNLQGRTRTQLIHFPPNYSPDENLPMILALHGSGSNSLAFLRLTQLGILGDSERFVVAFPQAATALFNGRNEINWNTDLGLGINDIGFLESVMDNAISEFGIDAEGIYTTGFSNGAFMASILTCERGDRISGLAPIAGHIGINRPTCLGENNVPSIFFHGDADTVVPIGGRAGQYNATASTVNIFADELGCGSTQTQENLPDIDMMDGSTVVRLIQDDCPDDTALEFYIIEGGRHRWPGANPSVSSAPTNQDISASVILWDFFTRFQ